MKADMRLDAWSIDNNAIDIVSDQLLHVLKYDPDLRFRVLDEAVCTERERVLYEEIFLPYCRESREHFDYHHNDTASDTWCGEQVCLAKIHYLNQKAWWLLHCFAVEEVIEQCCTMKKDKLQSVARHVARCILDGDRSPKDAVDHCITPELKLRECQVIQIADALETKLQQYQNSQSHPMSYR